MNDKELLIPATQAELPGPNPQTRRGRIQMILLLLFCAAPVIASYLAYYVFKLEGGKTNFGTFVIPPQAVSSDWLGIPLTGKWTLLVVRPAAECRVGNDACVKTLYLMRQVRIALSKESSRLRLIWVVSDDKPVDPEIRRAYDQASAGMQIFNAPTSPALKAQWDQWLNRENAGQQIQLIDPRGDKMMWFPAEASPADFAAIRKDLDKLLRLNHSGESLR
ncbi:hypothetical protein LZG75_00490 [Polynucleobacter sp. IMCC30063]|uniref:hypothetical protein n=1 Tax=Polynucleobacter sp. IMCC30063 TaxID=2907298 RepID=UPI001F33C5B6|nr:hypothetical protein [Polynucleobacter sp. IMCC30063]